MLTGQHGVQTHMEPVQAPLRLEHTRLLLVLSTLSVRGSSRLDICVRRPRLTQADRRTHACSSRPMAHCMIRASWWEKRGFLLAFHMEAFSEGAVGLSSAFRKFET